MHTSLDKIVSRIIKLLAAITALLLVFITLFIARESIPAFKQIGVADFVFGSKWYPVAFVGEPSYGIFNMIVATLYVSAIAVAIALVVGVGAAVFLSCQANQRQRNLLYPFIDLLAGIPSVVYGFVGLMVIVKCFENLGRSAGESVLAGGILLSIMILPFMISACSETMLKHRKAYEKTSSALGVSKWYMVTELILPASRKSILVSMALAIGRAMGETMAVMMVIGNSTKFPTLLGKAQTIPALIALEMGMVEVNSLHYHALYAAGLVLMLLLFAINAIIMSVKQKVLE